MIARGFSLPNSFNCGAYQVTRESNVWLKSAEIPHSTPEGTSVEWEARLQRFSVPSKGGTNVGAAVCPITSEGWEGQQSYKDLWILKICYPWSWYPQTWLPHETKSIYSLSKTQRAGPWTTDFTGKCLLALLCIVVCISHSIEFSADLCQSHSPEPRLSHEVATCEAVQWNGLEMGRCRDFWPPEQKNSANRTLLKMAPDYSTRRICWERQWTPLKLVHYADSRSIICLDHVCKASDFALIEFAGILFYSYLC